MATFEVLIQKIFIKPHWNADALEIGSIGSHDGWQVVVKKDQYKTGDLVAYIGENAIVPEWILKSYGFWNEEKNVGLLAGKQGNRVKAVKLRGAFSLGICLPVDKVDGQHFISVPDGTTPEGAMLLLQEEQDIAEDLGITKYEPPIPTQMSGELYNAGQAITVNYDVENIKNWPDVIGEGEPVQITEKLHGILCQIICVPFVGVGVDPSEHLLVSGDSHRRRYIGVASKGLGAAGLCFKHNDANKNNVYLRATQKYWEGIANGLSQMQITSNVVILGEVFGDGIQDLKYGMKNEIGFRVFDIYVGRRGLGRYLSCSELNIWCTWMHLEWVPVLYRGPFSKALLEQHTQHTKSTFDSNQVREGVVIKSLSEREVPELGRVSLKSINEDYYLRRGTITEFN
ncbi:MAG: RNA ligase (ATP) [Nitrosopumilaceae archaeon]